MSDQIKSDATIAATIPEAKPASILNSEVPCPVCRCPPSNLMIELKNPAGETQFVHETCFLRSGFQQSQQIVAILQRYLASLVLLLGGKVQFPEARLATEEETNELKWRVAPGGFVQLVVGNPGRIVLATQMPSQLLRG